METATLLAQTLMSGSLAAWLTVGVRDNILYPSLNEQFTREMMEMARMRLEYPDEYAQLAHRAITDRRLQKLAFRIVVAAELATVILLWSGTAALVMALLGSAEPLDARTLALFGTVSFSMIWAAMLVVGNHFSYWFCHEGAQTAHYHMTLWGLGTMILLIVGKA